ncbi:hypothetical protein FRC18_010313 [Serendipita sp. 400]|nr:hypothetical protein FRC18_010313 [Serendipita sp. 400]
MFRGCPKFCIFGRNTLHNDSYLTWQAKPVIPALYHRRFIHSVASKTSNAAHLAQLAERKERERHIIHLVEKRVQLRERLIAESLQTSEGDFNVNHVDRIKMSKFVKELEPLMEPWEQWKSTVKALEESAPLLQDPDQSLRAMAEEESKSLQNTLDKLLQEVFPPILIPSSPTGEVSALVELKAGAGGEEASLFVADLLRMYLRYVDVWGPDISCRGADMNRGGNRGWKATILSQTSGASGTSKESYKEVVLEVKGRGAYDTFRWETGVHRVQRVPATEASGRMHTSAVAVVVLPLTEESRAEASLLTFEVDEKDVKLEVMRARGAGGQHVNKTESAVRLTHLPTGITVSMQDSRSQHTNKQYAWKILRSRLFDLKLREDAERNRDTRRTLVKGMDRSDKIRTYNFVQDRVTDHRTGFTTMNLSHILEGEGLERVVDACRKRHEEDIMVGLLEGSVENE